MYRTKEEVEAVLTTHLDNATTNTVDDLDLDIHEDAFDNPAVESRVLALYGELAQIMHDYQASIVLARNS